MVRGDGVYIPEIEYHSNSVYANGHEILNDVDWISNYLADEDTFGKVELGETVHMIAKIRVTGGSIDVKIGAFKNMLKTIDPSHTPLPGEYFNDYQYKGVADSLPEVTANLYYTIDESTQMLPVILHNTYTSPAGYKIPVLGPGNPSNFERWKTHINPQAENGACIPILSSYSDILSFKYTDSRGTWLFDADHSALAPGVQLTNKNVVGANLDKAANLGNYGVTTNYVLTINNTSDTVRNLIYKAKIDSNYIIRVLKSDGEVLVSKSRGEAERYIDEGRVNTKRVKEERTMVDEFDDVTLMPGKNVYTLQVISPTSVAGGIEHVIEIR